MSQDYSCAFSLMTPSASVMQMVEAIKMCFIAEKTFYDKAALLLTCNATKCADGCVVSIFLTTQLLLVVIYTVMVSVYSKDYSAWDALSGLDVFVPQQWLFAVTFSLRTPSSTTKRFQVSEHMNRLYAISVLLYVFDFNVFVPYTLRLVFLLFAYCLPSTCLL